MRHLPVTLGVGGVGLFLLLSAASTIENPEKSVLLLFGSVLISLIVVSVNHFWHLINVAMGSKVTKYEINDVDVLINDKQKIPLTSIERMSTLAEIQAKLRPYNEWKQEHPSNKQPIYFTIKTTGGNKVIGFATDYEHQHFLRSLSQYFNN